MRTLPEAHALLAEELLLPLVGAMRTCVGAAEPD